jgi:hypothetical protein
MRAGGGQGLRVARSSRAPRTSTREGSCAAGGAPSGTCVYERVRVCVCACCGRRRRRSAPRGASSATAALSSTAHCSRWAASGGDASMGGQRALVPGHLCLLAGPTRVTRRPRRAAACVPASCQRAPGKGGVQLRGWHGASARERMITCDPGGAVRVCGSRTLSAVVCTRRVHRAFVCRELENGSGLCGRLVHAGAGARAETVALRAGRWTAALRALLWIAMRAA